MLMWIPWVVCALGAMPVVDQAQPPPRMPVVAPATSQTADGGGFTLVKRRPAEKARGGGGGGGAPLRGTVAWLVTGSLAALLPLTVFALPVLVLSWWGPLGFLGGWWGAGVFAAAGVTSGWLLWAAVVTVWAAAATAAGGGLVWLLSAWLTEIRSGFLIPTLVSMAVGTGTILSGAVVSALMVITSWAMAGFILALPPWGSPSDVGVIAQYPRTHPLWPLAAFTMSTGMVLATCVWLGSVLAGSVAGPLLAAYVYRQTGIPRTDDRIHVDVVTPAR